MFGLEKKKTVVMNVNGMHCMHCANKVVKALSALSGVSKVAVDLDAKKVTVNCKESFDVAKLAETVNSLGFEVIA